MDESFKVSGQDVSEANNIQSSTNPLASSDLSPRQEINQFRFSQLGEQNSNYENRFQSLLYNYLEIFLQNYIESVALLKYDEIMNQQVYMKQAVDHLKQQLITQMNSMFKLRNDSQNELQEFDKYRTIQITIIQNLTGVPIQLKEVVDQFQGNIDSMEIMRNPIPPYPIKQQNNFNLSIIGDLKRNLINEKIQLQVNQLLQQLYLTNLSDQLYIIKQLQNIISMKIIEQDIDEELAKSQIQQLKQIFPIIGPILTSLEEEITQKTKIPLKFNENDHELIQLIIDKSLYKRKSVILYQNQSQSLNKFLQILKAYLENMDNIEIKNRLLLEQKQIQNKQGLAEIQNFIISTRLINLFEKLQEKDGLIIQDLELKYCLTEDLQTISKFSTQVINQADQQPLNQQQQQTTTNEKQNSIIVTQNQQKLNESLIKVHQQDNTKIDLNDNQVKRLMYDDFKKILVFAYKFQPFQSSIDESVYAKFYLNEFYITFNLSNNLYYFLNKRKCNLTQNKRDLLDLLKIINQNGYQFGGHIKEVLDNYVNIHLSENGFKRHLYDLVKIPEDAQLDIEVELQQRYSSEVTIISGLFVVEDQPISQAYSDQLRELLNKVRIQSQSKVSAIDEDQIYSQMKAECYKSIPIFAQSEFMFLLRAIKNDSLQNEEFCKEAKKYYKPVYKATLEQFKNCENEKIKEALAKILSGK